MNGERFVLKMRFDYEFIIKGMNDDMSKEFAMLEASRRLGNYLSREQYNLDKMAENPRVPQLLFETKVEQYNELVDSLNDLFGALTGSTSSLFTNYGLVTKEASPNLSAHEMLIPPLLGGLRQSGADMIPDAYLTHGSVLVAEPPVATGVVTSPNDTLPVDGSTGTEANADVPTWMAEGYPSYEDWCADKEAGQAELHDDVSVVVNVGLSQYRAAQVLNEYEQTSDHDIATFNPEQDAPVDVLSRAQSMRATQDLRYLSHTVGNVRVDRDPTQITAVETAVERDGDDARKGMDIDVSQFVYRTPSMLITNLIDDDISKLRVHQ